MQHTDSVHNAPEPCNALRCAGVPLILPDACLHDVQCEFLHLYTMRDTHVYITQAYLILAVVLGAAIGHYLFNPAMNVDAVLSGSSAGKGMACH